MMVEEDLGPVLSEFRNDILDDAYTPLEQADTDTAIELRKALQARLADVFNSSQTRKNRAVCSVISLKAVVRTRPAAICTDFRMFSVPVKNMHIKTSGIAPSVLQSPMRRSAIDLRSITEGTAESRNSTQNASSAQRVRVRMPRPPAAFSRAATVMTATLSPDMQTETAIE